MINYFTNLGKLKALYLVHREHKNPAEGLKEVLEAKLKKLRIKLEKVDVELVDQVQAHQSKQAIYESYFSSLGELSVIKCGVKGLDFRHIFDYLALVLIKLRTYESVANLCAASSGPQESPAAPKVPKLTAENFASLLKLQKLKYIDKLFNVGCADSGDSGINHEKYQDELGDMVEVCGKLSQAYANFNAYDIAEKARTQQYGSPDFIAATAKASM